MPQSLTALTPHGSEKWNKQLFTYVDPWQCVQCHNCHEAAPNTFAMDNEHGKARVDAQWGDPEDEIDWAVASCPVQCIHWVSRDDLQILEHVTAQKMYDAGNYIEYSSNGRARVDLVAMVERFKDSGTFKGKVTSCNNPVRADELTKKIQKVFDEVPKELLHLVWPSLLPNEICHDLARDKMPRQDQGMSDHIAN